MTSKILVTGAAGTIGRAVVAALAGHPERPEIVALDRDTPAARRALRPFAGRATLVFGDITRPNTLAAACAGVDVVIHLAAVMPPVADDDPMLADRVNRGGTAALVAALEQDAPGAFLIFASSIAVYGDRLTRPDIRVGDPLVPSEGDYYAQTKIAGEAITQASQLDWTILRLTAVMGGHGMSPLMFHMPLDTVLEIVTIEDAARALVGAAFARNTLSGRIFNVGGGRACRTDYRSFLANSFARAGLGAFDLPEAAFATRNFHCGALVDGDELEAILHFRHDTLEDYYDRWARALPWWQRHAARLLRAPIKARLVAGSEPLKALKAEDAAGLARFFGRTRPGLRP